MKKNSIIITASLLIIASLSYIVYQKSRLCESCKFKVVDEIRLPQPTNLSLKIDCSNTGEYQPFQFDIINSYGILGKVKTNNTLDTIESIDFSIFEAAECVRFYISNVNYKYDNTLGGHHFTFEINNKKYKKEGVTKTSIKEKIPILEGELVFVSVISKNDSRIETRLLIPNDGSPTAKIHPPFICQGEIIL